MWERWKRTKEKDKKRNDSYIGAKHSERNSFFFFSLSAFVSLVHFFPLNLTVGGRSRTEKRIFDNRNLLIWDKPELAGRSTRLKKDLDKDTHTNTQIPSKGFLYQDISYVLQVRKTKKIYLHPKLINFARYTVAYIYYCLSHPTVSPLCVSLCAGMRLNWMHRLRAITCVWETGLRHDGLKPDYITNTCTLHYNAYYYSAAVHSGTSTVWVIRPGSPATWKWVSVIFVCFSLSLFCM